MSSAVGLDMDRSEDVVLRQRPRLGPPIFVLCPARSGSTLLRYVLDAHPAIFAPAETNLSSVLAGIHSMAHVLLGDGEMADLAAEDQSRQLAQDTIGQVAADSGASRWCDKSLTSVHHAPYLARVFPDAQFICLYRNCRDFLLSAVEASPWGYNAYGFDAYVRASPDNVVPALSAYWADVTAALLNFEEEHPSVSIRVRYEDMALNPTATVNAIWEFLQIEPAPLSPDAALSGHHGTGPGDHKVDFTTRIEATSVNKAAAVPFDHIPRPLLDRLNALHSAVGYNPISTDATPTWRALPENGADIERAASSRNTADLLNVIAGRLEDNPAARGSAESDSATVAIELSGHSQTWLIDLASSSVSVGQSADAIRVICAEKTLREVLTDVTNFASAMRHGLITIAPPEGADEEATHRALRALVAAIRPTQAVTTLTEPGQDEAGSPTPLEVSEWHSMRGDTSGSAAAGASIQPGVM